MRMRKQKNDYTSSMLPQNRREVFFDVVSLHWKKLLGLGMVVLLFSLPLLISRLSCDMYSYQSQYSVQQASEEEQRLAAYTVAVVSSIKSVMDILFYAILSVCLAGLSRMIRQYAWEEHVAGFADFIRGIRDNWKQMLPAGVIFGIVLSVYKILLNMWHFGPEWMFPLSVIHLAVLAFLVLPVLAISISMIPIYSNGFLSAVKFALAVYLKKPTKVLPTLALCLLVYIPAIYPNFTWHMVWGIISGAATPFVLLAWNLRCYDWFDDVINSRYYPELVGRGILGIQTGNQ